MSEATLPPGSGTEDPADRLVEFLSARGKEISPLLILTHDFPDPDALASAYALQYLAERAYGISSRIVYGGMIGRPENQNMVRLLDLPVHPLKRRDLKRFVYTALVDTQPCFENNPFPCDRRATLVIDQHASRRDLTSAADCLLVDTNCGATCVILAQAIQRLELPYPERLATALAYGIISDTLNLYRASRADIVETYLAVLACANMRTLARIQTPIYGKEFFTVLQNGIQNARISQGLVVCHLGRVTNPDAVSQIAEFLLSYRAAKWVLSTGRFKKKLHLSLRTVTKEFPAPQLLRACVPRPEDAGGHGHVAGGAVKVPSQEEAEFSALEEQLETKLRKRLNLRKSPRFGRLHLCG